MGYDLVVVGGGPAGLTVSSILKHYNILVVEEHSRPGYPKHCTGLVGEYTARFYVSLLGGDIIDNRYRGAIFHIGGKRYIIESRSGKPLAYHINRPLLEEKLYERTIGLGHEVLLSTKAKPDSNSGVVVEDRVLKPKYIIASDGPLSIFKKRIIGSKPRYLVGVQRVYRGYGFRREYFHITYLPGIPEFFQWLVPLDDDIVLVGYAVYPYRRFDPEKIFSSIARVTGVDIGGVVESYGGLIPLNKPLKKPFINNIFFIGDSLPASKPYTGGGIYAIAYLAPSLARSIELDDPEIYMERYSSLRRRLLLERRVVEIFRMIDYSIPARVLNALYKSSIDPSKYYDYHLGLIIETIKHLPSILVNYM